MLEQETGAERPGREGRQLLWKTKKPKELETRSQPLQSPSKGLRPNSSNLLRSTTRYLGNKMSSKISKQMRKPKKTSDRVT